MLYNILKFPARLAIKIYCKNIKINDKNILTSKGPLLIACNHPNSFLDAVILATLFKKPVYSLARGDTFKNKYVSKLLHSLNILPVYRISEGAENLNNNYDTFSKCRDIFKQNGIVLIFSEGLCINEWKLRSLKKGTARLAFSSWEDEIDLTILPTGINYHSFSSFGKNVKINFGNSFNWNDLERKNMDGHSVNKFNDKLKSNLIQLVDHIDSADSDKIKDTFFVQHPILLKALLFFPALIGKYIHGILYVPIQNFAWKKAGKSDHYDSVLVGLLFILYPIFLSIIALLIYFLLGGSYWILAFLIIPFLAWAFVQTKKQF